MQGRPALTISPPRKPPAEWDNRKDKCQGRRSTGPLVPLLIPGRVLPPLQTAPVNNEDILRIGWNRHRDLYDAARKSVPVFGKAACERHQAEQERYRSEDFEKATAHSVIIPDSKGESVWTGLPRKCHVNSTAAIILDLSQACFRQLNILALWAPAMCRAANQRTKKSGYWRSRASCNMASKPS